MMHQTSIPTSISIVSPIRVLAVVALALLLDLPSPARAQTVDQPARSDRRLTAVRATAPVSIDGRLDEADWRQAPVARGFIQNEPREGEPASDDTEVRVLYDDENLYIGVFAHDRDPQAAIINDLRKDFVDTTTDAFEVILDTFHDGRNGYIFGVNPAGAKYDAQMINEGRETNASWDAIWNTRTRIAEDGWYAEIEIPFKTLRFGGERTQSWGVNFMRRIRRRNEDSFWAPLPRIWELSRVSLAGTLDGLQGLRAGKDFRVKPYALGSVGATASSPSTGDRNGGFDVKYGLGSGLTWDFTVNTDFAQVEADEQQVNLGRISLFFPEKRDFFLENSGVFAFGAARLTASGGVAMAGGGGRVDDAARNDPVLFFSRRIGLSPGGGSLPILAGTRLTGRMGPYTVGVLNIQQRADQGAPDGNFTALRLRRDVLSTSDVGVMFLNKETDGPAYNRAAGFDANFRFFGNLNINNQISKTFSPEAVQSVAGGAVYYRSSFDYRGNVWDVRGGYGSIGDRYNNEMGYVPRVGVKKTTAFVAPHFRPKNRSGWLRESFPHVELINISRQDGSLESRYVDYHVPLMFNDGGFTELQFNHTTEGLRAPFLISANRGISIPVGEYSFNEWALMFRTNPSAAFNWNVRLTLGDFYDGYKHSYQAGFTTRFNERFNVASTYTRNELSLPAGAYATDLLTSRVNVSFSTNVFLNALIQYNTDARMWTSNVRFNIIHRPLSDFFLVYNERRDSTTDDLIDRAVIAKVTYMMAF
jgi:Domain of unknown function (DUF5916)/Carbohydrate family 9 binding domain-like